MYSEWFALAEIYYLWLWSLILTCVAQCKVPLQQSLLAMCDTYVTLLLPLYVNNLLE